MSVRPPLSLPLGLSLGPRRPAASFSGEQAAIGNRLEEEKQQKQNGNIIILIIVVNIINIKLLSLAVCLPPPPSREISSVFSSDSIAGGSERYELTAYF